MKKIIVFDDLELENKLMDLTKEMLFLNKCHNSKDIKFNCHLAIKKIFDVEINVSNNDEKIIDYNFFLDFLIENDIEDIFVKNFFNDKSKDKIYDLKYYFKLTDKKNIFLNAFDWSVNQEFWKIINERWLKVIV